MRIAFRTAFCAASVLVWTGIVSADPLKNETGKGARPGGEADAERGYEDALNAYDEAAGKEHVLAMAGCYAVTYRFYEDGKHDYFNDEYGLDAPIREMITLVENEPRQITLQHSSINRRGDLVPHWHEEWRYSDAGWAQTVYSRTPDDELREQRYTCTAPWSLNRWQCRAGPAKKPFRDSGAPFGFPRTDYEWLDRDNTLLVTPEGWVQSEHNRKMDEAGRLVSYELGFIIYERLDEAECATGQAAAPLLAPEQ
jgi:hypothetical protein